MEHKILIPDDVKTIMSTLIQAGYQAYIFGGAVRDSIISSIYKLRWLVPKDYDIFTDANGDEILSLFPNGEIIGSPERRETVLTVIINGIEVSQFRKSGDRTITGTNIKDHISTCDFRFNALYCDIDGTVYDTVGGISDIRNGLVVTVGNPDDRFNEDPLRVLRALRFSTKYKFTIDPWVASSVRAFMNKALCVSQERVHSEVMKILSYGGNKEHEKILDYYLYEKMFPELINCYKIGYHGKWHPETLKDHIRKAFLGTVTLSRSPLLRLASLLHDIGKACCLDEENVTFYSHHKAGADIAREYLKNWKFKNEEIDYVCGMIYHHMDDINNIKQVNKFVRALNEFGADFEDFCVMSYADRNANLYWKPAGYNEWLKGFVPYTLYKDSLKFPTLLSVKDLKVNGTEIMSYCGLSPGPAVGKVLKTLLERVDSGQLVNEKYSLLPAAVDIAKELAP